MPLIKGLENVKALESSISFIDGKKGELYYRGYAIEDLIEGLIFEDVIYLLWFDKLPTKDQLTSFKRKLNKNMLIPSSVKKVIQSLPRDTNMMAGVRTAVSVLGACEQDRKELGRVCDERIMLRTMGTMVSIIAAVYRHNKGKSILNPKKDLSLAANFLYMLHGRVPTAQEEEVFDVCLRLHAEHGLNASTFAARVTASTLSDTYSAITSAIGTLKGPLHGGANKRVIQTLNVVKGKAHIRDVCGVDCRLEVDKYVNTALRKHQRIMGIGHRVYKVKDPRAIILEKYARELTKEKPVYFQMAKEIEREMEKQKNLHPNVDFFSGIVYHALGIPSEVYVSIFSLARTSGWLAHVCEQYSDNRLIRPRAEYVGKLGRKR